MKKFLIIMLNILPAVQVPVKAAAPAFTQNQYNIAALAEYYYNMTWECQKTVYGWREQYTFYEGETYRIPYAQPVISGQYIGYGISYEDFLVAATDESNVFYSKQAEWSGWDIRPGAVISISILPLRGEWDSKSIQIFL